MYITIKYGDNIQKVVNPNCGAKSLLEFIRKQCSCNETDILDLVDETGVLKKLNEQPDTDNVKTILQSKAIYIPVLVLKGESEENKEFVPLLKEIEELYPGLLEKLQSFKKKSGGRKSRLEPSHTPHKKSNVNVNTAGKGTKGGRKK
ncbi:unnamed protein product [Owenia fusiformis]|uniref:Uncharacterized protein n=1 Tax=Owenia fusiformis TaxID=6347 RepID=A0A8J1TAD5_OWEFU|nr:unnamed protein product [Owenia fusiformis]